MKQTKGIVSSRRNEILNLLAENSEIRNEELAEKLHTSPLTIRRDLQFLEAKGLVKRFYGGAILLKQPADSQNSTNAESILNTKKHLIAKFAANLVEDGDTIFINTSSTALLMLEYLGNKTVVVVTNNGKALQSTISPNVELVLTGGQVNSKKQSMVGDFATYILSQITASKCFLGVSGIDIESGLSTSVLQETLVNKEMINRSNGPVFILADSSKIGHHHNFSSGTIDKVSHIITDSDISTKDIAAFESIGIKVSIVS